MRYLLSESQERLENAELMFGNECDFRIDTNDRVYVVTEVLGFNGDSEDVGVYRNIREARNKVDLIENEIGNPAYFMEYVLVEYKEELLSQLDDKERAETMKYLIKRLDDLSNEEIKEVSDLVLNKVLDKNIKELLKGE